MPTVTAESPVGASAAEVWDLYFEPQRWPAWVDGFSSVIDVSAEYPQEGSTLRWRSVPAGRGEVSERVLEHEPRRRHRIAFSDPESEGELETSFGIEGETTRVALELSYRLRAGGPFARFADFLFVRSQMRRSLGRTLERLKVEAEERAAR